jgi:hypothetical protein
MSDLTPLKSCAGAWTGPSRLIVTPGEAGRVSQSRLVVSVAAGGKCVRVDYTWADEGKPQDGVMLFGFDRDSGVVTMAWIDSWHMGEKVMICSGAAKGDGSVDVLGHYAAPPGADWGWRTVLAPSGERLMLRMFNVSPEGVEALAVEAEYRRGSE